MINLMIKHKNYNLQMHQKVNYGNFYDFRSNLIKPLLH